jgi:hypothetical protein
LNHSFFCSENIDLEDDEPSFNPSVDPVVSTAHSTAIPRVKLSNAKALLSRGADQSVPKPSKAVVQPSGAPSLFQKLKVQDSVHHGVKSPATIPEMHFEQPQAQPNMAAGPSEPTRSSVSSYEIAPIVCPPVSVTTDVMVRHSSDRMMCFTHCGCRM